MLSETWELVGERRFLQAKSEIIEQLNAKIMMFKHLVDETIMQPLAKFATTRITL